VIHDLTLATDNENTDFVMAASTAGIHRVRTDTFGDIRVDLDSSIPCWNDATAGALLELTEVRPPIFSKANKITKFKITDSEPFVLLYFRICARRGNFSHLETLGFGYSSGQDAKNAKFGNLFLLCAFTSLREMFRFFLVAASPR